MKLNNEQSRACYRAAYHALKRHVRNGLDVVIDLDHPESRGIGQYGAGALASGCACDGDTVVFANVSAADFGDIDINADGDPTMSEDEFVGGCMESFGRIEIEDAEIIS